MEILIVLLVLLAFDIAATRWGQDSRETHRSAEAWLAAHGFAWCSRVGVGR